MACSSSLQRDGFSYLQALPPQAMEHCMWPGMTCLRVSPILVYFAVGTLAVAGKAKKSHVVIQTTSSQLWMFFFSLCLKHKLLSRQKCGPVLMKNASRHFIFASVFVCFLPPIHPSSEPAASLFLESWGCCSSLSCCWVKVGRLHPAISYRATLTKTYQACFWTVRENPHIHEDNMQTPLAVISYLNFIFKTHLKHQWYIKKKRQKSFKH